MKAPLILRRKLLPPRRPVDLNASGYSVRFGRVRVGCVFKWRSDWYIKKNDTTATLNGTYEIALFHRSASVFVQSMDDLMFSADDGIGVKPWSV